MVLSSNTLFHFTNNVDIVKKIIENNFYPRCCVEDLQFLMPNYKGDEAKVGLPMVCFCDIPLSRISNHLDDYGYYGIGLTKEWGIKNGINPIHYIQEKTLAHTNLTNLEEALVNIIDEINRIDNYLEFRHRDKNINRLKAEISSKAFKCFWEFAGYLKIYKGINNKNIHKEKIFYDEREWRFIPNIIDDDIDGYTYRLIGKDCLDEAKKSALNETLSKKSPLKFEAKDIKYIILKDNNEITDFMNYIDALPNERFEEEEKNILKTKIITVNNIIEDF